MRSGGSLLKRKCGFRSLGYWGGGMVARGMAREQVELNWLAIFSVYSYFAGRENRNGVEVDLNT